VSDATTDHTARLDEAPTEHYDHTDRIDSASFTRAADKRADVLATDLAELYERRHKGTLVHRPADVGRDYVTFALNPEARVPLGWEWLDATLRGGIAPGELGVLAGGSSSAKTTLLGNIPVNSPHIPMLFCSIEMPMILVAARLFAMLEGEEYRTLEARLAAGSDNLQARIERELAVSVPHLGLMGVGGPSIETLGKAVAEYREHWDQNPRLLMVDYLDLMAPASQSVEAVKQKLVELRAFAKAEELAVLILHQLKREVLEGRHGEPVRFTDCRYAGETEADHLLGIYRRINDPLVRAQPALYEMYLRTVHVQVLKTRSDIAPRELEGHELGFNPDTLRITDTTDGLLEPIPTTLGQAGRVLAGQGGLFDGASR
jgi:replicative DNA helicase